MTETKEICNECGRDVSPGSGLFVDRVPSGDDVETHREMGKPFPEGGFTCRECEADINENLAPRPWKYRRTFHSEAIG